MQKKNEPHDLYIVEGDKETPCYGYTSSDLERDLSIPLLEILKYPYLLLNERLSEYPTCSVNRTGMSKLCDVEADKEDQFFTLSAQDRI